MSTPILDFAAADASAKQQAQDSGAAYVVAYPAAYRAALEAQAQARLTALESEWDKTHDEEVALLGRLVVEYRTRAEAAEAALKAERECEHGTPFEQECPECAKWWRNVRDKLATGLTSLRAEHQRLTDAVVNSVRMYFSTDTRVWGDWWRIVNADGALAAFEAQHPEVRG